MKNVIKGKKTRFKGGTYIFNFDKNGCIHIYWKYKKTQSIKLYEHIYYYNLLEETMFYEEENGKWLEHKYRFYYINNELLLTQKIY